MLMYDVVEEEEVGAGDIDYTPLDDTTSIDEQSQSLGDEP